MKSSLTTYQENRVALALALKAVGAVLTKESDHPLVIERDGPNGKERGFKLKSHAKKPDAPLSPIFLNLRTPDNPKPGPLTQNEIRLAADCMLYVVQHNHLEFDGIVGVPNAGDPFAKELARLTGKPFYQMNKIGEGDKRRVSSLVDVDIPKGTKVLMVDDLITEADSKKEASKVIRDHGLDVQDVLVLVDREQGGRQELLEWGYNLHSVFPLSELLRLYVFAQEMRPQLYDEIREYFARAAVAA